MPRKKVSANPMYVEDLNFIMLLFEEKGWHGAEICRQFPSKEWNPSYTINYNIRKMKNTGSIQRMPGTGLHNRTVCTDENETTVNNLVCSQDSDPGTHESQRDNGKVIGASQRSVSRMIKDSDMKPYHRIWSTEVADDAKVVDFPLFFQFSHFKKVCARY